MSKTMAELKALNLEPCSAESLSMNITGEAKEEATKKINEYLSNFVYASKCLGCDYDLGGLLGMFQWGIEHGEGFCSNCGYPARAYHKVKDICSWSNMILQYHPNTLIEKEKEAI